jgi:hypothetical protein
MKLQDVEMKLQTYKKNLQVFINILQVFFNKDNKKRCIQQNVFKLMFNVFNIL